MLYDKIINMIHWSLNWILLFFHMTILCAFFKENFGLFLNPNFAEDCSRGPMSTKLRLVRVMAWRPKSDNHYLKRKWSSSTTHRGFTKAIYHYQSYDLRSQIWLVKPYVWQNMSVLWMVKLCGFWNEFRLIARIKCYRLDNWIFGVNWHHFVVLSSFRMVCLFVCISFCGKNHNASS